MYSRGRTRTSGSTIAIGRSVTTIERRMLQGVMKSLRDEIIGNVGERAVWAEADSRADARSFPSCHVGAGALAVLGAHVLCSQARVVLTD